MSRNSGGLFGKFKVGCLVVVLAAIVIYIGLAVVQCAHDKSSKNVPDIQKAPFAIQTDSRAYFSSDGQVTDSNGKVVINFSQITGSYTLKVGERLMITDWYDMIKNKWTYRKGNSPVFDRDGYLNIEITRRKK